MPLIDKIRSAVDRHREIERQMSLPDVAADPKRLTELGREYKRLTPLVGAFSRYEDACRACAEAEELLADPSLDPGMRALAEEELQTGTESRRTLYEELRLLLIPHDPNDDRNVVIELRQGAGGEEAALFAQDLYRMYTMFAAKEGFRTELADLNPTELGGIKQAVFLVSGEGAYARFKYESGVHRVQRIPVTESNGKIQTSTVTVAVLPEVGAVEVEVNPADIHFESCKSSGAGGQHINKTESAVRLYHKPSGIVIECDQERSQLMNKEKALKLLYAKLYDQKQREQNEKIAGERRLQVGTGDRSEKIRTYNFPQSRVTDHRINKTLYSLASFLNGDMAEMIDELTAFETAERLKGEETI